MKSVHATLALIAFWACIYLPGLGGREIRGEEWRRVLPARTMLNTGEWLVPYSGGKPYLRKPPLINWVTAATFKLTGVQNEWSARLPSALLMLAAALGIHAFTRRALGAEAAFVGCIFMLTSVGVIEKGRIAELEVYYIAFTGLAFSAWLAGFMGKLNRWAAWLWAGLFLGLGFLAKGPMHLLFFYFLVLGACWKTARWRELASLPHVAGLLLCLGMILAWAIPFMGTYGRLMQVSGWDVLSAWSHEVSSRVTGEEETSATDWLVRGPRALVMFLPWVLLLPLWWKRDALESALTEGATRKLFIGLRWGVVAGFAAMVLLPSSSARYVAPLLGPVALLTGWVFVGWWAAGRKTPPRTAVGWGAAVSVVLLNVTLLFLAARDSGGADIRPTSHAIRDAMVPKDGPLYVFHLGQVPYPFYLPEDSIELYDFTQLPDSGVRWMLTTSKTDQDFRLWFERRHGRATKMGEFSGTWGDSSQDKNRQMVLLRFAGK